MKSTRAAAWIWYRGDLFRGFQSQPGGGTVQQTLSAAFAELGSPLTPMPAGRTDRGVHARMQVISFRLRPGISLEQVRERLPPRLPPGALGLVSLLEPPPAFHAGWSAAGKEYRYRIALDPEALPPAWKPFAWELRAEPRLSSSRFDPARFAFCLRRAEGTRDFIAFHEKSSVQRPRTLREAVVVEPLPGLLEVRLRGDSFARYQVRFLVGTCALVACGELPLEAFLQALERGTPVRGLRAPAEALTLWEVLYPPEVEPFGAALRANPPGVPDEPPFTATGGASPRTSRAGR